MVANKKTKKMLNASRGMKAISILVASCMLFALTGCDSKEESATTEVTTQVAGATIAETTTTEATTTEATTTEATTTTPTTTIPTTTTSTTTTPTTTTAPTTEATTAVPTTTTTTTTTAAPTEAPSLTVPDEVPDNAEADVEEYTPEEHENEQAPQNPPADDPDNGYWHDEPTNTITMADLQAEAEAAVAQISAVGASSHGQTISNSYVCRATDTQYGIYVYIINSSGEDWSSGIVKAENVGGSIQVYWSTHSLRDPVDEGYDSLTRYQDISVIYQQLRDNP